MKLDRKTKIYFTLFLKRLTIFLIALIFIRIVNMRSANQIGYFYLFLFSTPLLYLIDHIIAKPLEIYEEIIKSNRDIFSVIRQAAGEQKKPLRIKSVAFYTKEEEDAMEGEELILDFDVKVKLRDKEKSS